MTDKFRDAIKTRSWSISHIFWGGLFVTLGVLALLNNFNVIDAAFAELWRLWPLVIIAIGVSLLRLSGAVNMIVKAGFALLVIGSIIYVTTNAFVNSDLNKTSTVTVAENGTIDKAAVFIRYGAGNLDIGSHESDVDITTADLNSRYNELQTSTSIDNDTKFIELQIDGASPWWRGNWQNDLSVSISENYALTLNIDAGASHIKANMSQLQLNDLKLRTGASSVELTFGDRSKRITADIDAGASSITVRVPEGAGVRVHPSATLGTTELANLREVDGVFESEDYEEADNQISITARIGAASFKLERY